MKNRQILKLLVGALFLVAFFGIVTPAAAKLKATAAFYVWDDNDSEYKNSVADLFLDGTETHVIHELGFDNDAYDPLDGAKTQEVCDKVAALNPDGIPNNGDEDPAWREDCPAAAIGAGNGEFAGVLELGIPYDDNDGARAFESSEKWSLIDCDLNGSGAWNGTDLTYNTLINYNPGGTPGSIPYLANWDIVNKPAMIGSPQPGTDQDDFFKILAIDKNTACSNNTCANELVTTIYLDLDISGNNDLSAAGDGIPVNDSGSLPSGRVCFFAKVFPITWPTNPATPVWSGNPQARFSAGGGDKTVNFNLFGPTAITLEQFGAESLGNVHPAIWLTIFLLLGAITFVLIRERAQDSSVTIRKQE